MQNQLDLTACLCCSLRSSDRVIEGSLEVCLCQHFTPEGCPLLAYNALICGSAFLDGRITAPLAWKALPENIWRLSLKRSGSYFLLLGHLSSHFFLDPFSQPFSTLLYLELKQIHNLSALSASEDFCLFLNLVFARRERDCTHLKMKSKKKKNIQFIRILKVLSD